MKNMALKSVFTLADGECMCYEVNGGLQDEHVCAVTLLLIPNPVKY